MSAPGEPERFPVRVHLIEWRATLVHLEPALCMNRRFHPMRMLPADSSSPSSSQTTWNRRAFLRLPSALWVTAAAGLRAAPISTVAAQKQVFLDPSTEFQVTRWTEESASAQLPSDPVRAIPRGDRQLLYASDRSGSWQPYAMQLPKGESIQLARAEQLHPASPAFLNDGRELVYLDGSELIRVQVQRNRARTLYHASDGWQPSGEMRVTADSRAAMLLETRDSSSRVVAVDLGNGRARPLFTAGEGGLRLLASHPRYGVLLLNADGTPIFQGGAVTPKLGDFPEGELLDAHLDRQSGHLLYLIRTRGPIERTQLMDLDLQTGTHALVANTSRFAAFAPNANGSVFVGASASLAQPLLLLLLRVTRREFALMEHRASEPSMVQPMFTHDSETVFFQSDRLGKSCILSVSVKGLVEKT